MVKQSPLQSDLFNHKFIEDQVKKIKESLEKEKKEGEDENDTSPEAEETTKDLLLDQLIILQEIQLILKDIEKNTHKKKRWYQLKDD